MDKRVDSLDKYYDKLNTLNDLCVWLFLINAIISILLFFLGNFHVLINVLNTIFIITTIIYFIADSYLSIYLIPSVEGKRRVNLISNSFDVPLDNETTNKYYNNNIEPSILKLGANVFENSLFAKEVTARMCVKERKKILVYVTLWVGALAFRNVDLELLTIISQTLFTSTLLTQWLKLEYLRNKNEEIYKCLYDLFLIYKDGKDKKLTAKFLDCFVSYEATKAYSGIKQSTEIFFEINDEFSQEWEKIKEKLNIQ